MKKYIYDQIPYDIRAYPSAHPRNLAAIGALYGLAAPPVDQCRVLVLGCAQGGNLFPMASLYAGSQFVGLDNSRRQIEAARATAAQLGLQNTTLHCMDIMDADNSLGQFDYIIAHGIYSWIPAPVREQVFRICKTLLSPNGIAYISYNTLPGWRINGIVRDIMLYRFSEHDDPVTGLGYALDYLKTIANSSPAHNNPYMTLLKQIQTQVSANNHTYLLHEYLSDINEAFYFHEIVEKGRGHGLQYLADAAFVGKELTSHSAQLNQRFQSISKDMTDYEQHFDFVYKRLFRSSLFCHQDVSLHDTIPGEPPVTLYCSSMAQAVDLPPGQYPTGAMGFSNEQGNVMVETNPLFLDIMKLLTGIYPQALALTQLLKEVKNPDAQDKDMPLLLGKLLRARAAGLINITTDMPPIVTPGSRPPPHYKPLAAPFACLQASSGNVVVSAWNENVGLNPFSRQALALMDGTRNIQEIRQALLSRCAEGELGLPGQDANPPHGVAERGAVEQSLETSLAFFSRAGLLISAAGGDHSGHSR